MYPIVSTGGGWPGDWIKPVTSPLQFQWDNQYASTAASPSFQCIKPLGNQSACCAVTCNGRINKAVCRDLTIILTPPRAREGISHCMRAPKMFFKKKHESLICKMTDKM